MKGLGGAGGGGGAGAGAGAAAAHVDGDSSDSDSDDDGSNIDSGPSWFDQVTDVTKYDEDGNPPRNKNGNTSYARKCNTCGQVFECVGKGTESTTICRHFREKGKRCILHKDIHRLMIENSKHSRTNTTASGDTVPVRTFADDFENLNNASCFIIHDNLALQSGESPNFRNYTVGLKADHRPPTAENVYDFAQAHLLLNKLRARQAVKNGRRFYGAKWMFLSLDMWSELHAAESYASLTMNFTYGTSKDEDQEPAREKVVLSMKPFGADRHTGENICAWFSEVLRDYGILATDIFLIVPDGAANGKKAVELYCEDVFKKTGVVVEWHVCYAHELQRSALISFGRANGDQNPELKAVLDKHSKLVGKIHHSTRAVQMLKKKQRDDGYGDSDILGLNPHAHTRWSGIFDSVERNCVLRSSLSHVASELSGDERWMQEYDSVNGETVALDVDKITITPGDWEISEQFLASAAPIRRAATLVQARGNIQPLLIMSHVYEANSRPRIKVVNPFAPGGSLRDLRGGARSEARVPTVPSQRDACIETQRRLFEEELDKRIFNCEHLMGANIAKLLLSRHYSRDEFPWPGPSGGSALAVQAEATKKSYLLRAAKHMLKKKRLTRSRKRRRVSTNMCLSPQKDDDGDGGGGDDGGDGDGDNDMSEHELQEMINIESDMLSGFSSENAQYLDSDGNFDDLLFYFHHRAIAPIHYQTYLSVDCDKGTEVEDERNFSWMNLLCSPLRSRLSSEKVMTLALVALNRNFCRHSIRELKAAYDHIKHTSHFPFLTLDAIFSDDILYLGR